VAASSEAATLFFLIKVSCRNNPLFLLSIIWRCMVTISEIARRNRAPLPWAEGEKIPWNEPTFSRRMLDEHLSQAHDMASRRTPTIVRQVEWIHANVFHAEPRRILDLGCGPGLYADPFVSRGHAYVGIDFSPASIEYARRNAVESASFTEGDVRTVGFGQGHSAVMLIYGEMNVFPRPDMDTILARACAALEKDGALILEPHTFDCVRRLGMAPPAWHAALRGVFSEKPYICLTENRWDEKAAVAIERFYVVEEGSTEAAFYTQSVQAYTDEQYARMVEKAGFSKIAFHPSLAGVEKGDGNLFGITARKAG
jgi:SAM-dependent methyltransferase